MLKWLSQSDLQEISDEMLTAFEGRLGLIPTDLCAPFYEEARNLETRLIMIYQFLVMLSRKEESLENVAALWSFMVRTCDQSAKLLHILCERHPDCGANTYYDRILDLRNKCHRLAQMHS